MATPKKSASKKAAPAKSAATKTKPAAKAVAKAKPVPKSKSETKSKPAAPVAAKKAEPTSTKKPMAAARPAPVMRPKPEPIPAPPPEPQKPQVDEEWQKNMRIMLAGQRQKLMSVVQSTQAQMAEKSGDLPDISDRASEGFEDELAVGLMAIEAETLENINEAIERIDNGTYGLCCDCGKAIPKKRLEFLPFAKRCLICEGQSERRSRAVEAEEEEEELD